MLTTLKTSFSPFSVFRRGGETRAAPAVPEPVSFAGGSDEAPAAATFGAASFKFTRIPVAFERPDLVKDPVFQGIVTQAGSALAAENDVGRELVRRYQQTKDPRALEQIYGHYDRLIEGTVYKHRDKRIPEPAVRARVLNAVHEAVETYDPSSPKTFHQFFREQKEGQWVSRWAGENTSFGKVNWTRSPKLQKLREYEHLLELEKGEAITNAELRRATGLSERDIRLGRQELSRDLISSKEMRQDFQLDHGVQHRIARRRVLDSLPSHQQKVFRDVDEGVLSNSEIARRHGMSDTALSRLKTRVGSLIQSELQIVEMEGI